MNFTRVLQIVALALTAWLIVSVVRAQNPTRPDRPTREPMFVIMLTPTVSGTFCQPFSYQFKVSGAPAGGVKYSAPTSIMGLTLDADTGLLHGTPQPFGTHVCGEQFTFAVSY